MSEEKTVEEEKGGREKSARGFLFNDLGGYEARKKKSLSAPATILTNTVACGKKRGSRAREGNLTSPVSKSYHWGSRQQAWHLFPSETVVLRGTQSSIAEGNT